MHAQTIQDHQRLQHEAREITTAWAGTDPMTSEEQVRQALTVDGEPEELEALLPYVVDACRERGLLVRPSWRDVPLYWLDSARALTETERLTALREYRETGGMYLVVCAEPTGRDSAEECERLSEAGPRPEEIDWSGFDETAAA